MANLLNYVDKYGHLSFEKKPFNDVDNLVFSMLSYLDYTDTRINENNLTLEEIGREFLMKHTFKEIRKKGIAQGDAYELLNLCVDSDRYRRIRVSDYIYNTNRLMMFSVMSFHIKKNLTYISFEGTDELISGWREDFEMACSFPVPSHLEAVKYLNEHVKLFGPNVIVGGHSKGGNLALVGVMMMNKLKSCKIAKIYNNDGPGLRKKEFESADYARIRSRYVHIVPHSTVVGIMMRNENYKVVESDKNSILGHSISTWQINGDKLKRAARSERSKEIERRLWLYLDHHDDAQRKVLLEAVFGTIEGCDILDTMSLLKFKNIVKMFKQAKGLDKESKDMVLEFAKTIAIKKQ